MHLARSSLQHLLERYEAPWEIFMMAMAVAFVTLGFVPHWLHFSPGALSVVDKVDWAITGLFVVEFAVRFWAARSRKQYLREHWLDLVAIIPTPFLRAFRVARLARVARLLRLLILIRFFRDLDSLFLHMKGIGRQWSFFKFLIGTVVVVAVSAGIANAAEKSVNPQMATYSDALWWAVVTVATVGYGDVVPVTTMGRLAAVVIMIGGVALWGLFIATTVTYFSAQRRQGQDPIIGEIKSKIDRLDELSEGELIALGGALDALLRAKRQRVASPQDPPSETPGRQG